MQSRIQHVWEWEGHVLVFFTSSELWKYWEKNLFFVLCHVYVIYCRYWHILFLGRRIFLVSGIQIIFVDQKCMYLAFWWTLLFHQSLLSGNARGTTGTFRFYWQTAGAPYSRLQAENKTDHRRSWEAGKEEWLQKKRLSETATSVVGKMQSVDKSLKC